MTIKNVYFDCAAYGRSRLGNCFVYLFDENEEKFGQIEYLINTPNQPFPDKLMASVKILKLLKKLDSLKASSTQFLKAQIKNLFD